MRAQVVGWKPQHARREEMRVPVTLYNLRQMAFHLFIYKMGQ